MRSHELYRLYVYRLRGFFDMSHNTRRSLGSVLFRFVEASFVNGKNGTKH